ncbi:hypothetical protein JXA63_01225 [Candidatus Woesebacteria bacterium]|nr:hypothetical protein [Candidatus Woesebacteria bacterium]
MNERRPYEKPRIVYEHNSGDGVFGVPIGDFIFTRNRIALNVQQLRELPSKTVDDLAIRLGGRANYVAIPTRKSLESDVLQQAIILNFKEGLIKPEEFEVYHDVYTQRFPKTSVLQAMSRKAINFLKGLQGFRQG